MFFRSLKRGDDIFYLFNQGSSVKYLDCGSVGSSSASEVSYKLNQIDMCLPGLPSATRSLLPTPAVWTAGRIEVCHTPEWTVGQRSDVVHIILSLHSGLLSLLAQGKFSFRPFKVTVSVLTQLSPMPCFCNQNMICSQPNYKPFWHVSSMRRFSSGEPGL